MVQIDNKKMWESLYRNGRKYEHFEQAIPDALKDQGLAVNNKGEIVRINPKLKLKEGDKYICIKDWLHDKYNGLYHKGGIYIVAINRDYKDVGLLADDGGVYPWGSRDIFEEYFRPATKDEIAANIQKQEASDELTEFEKELIGVCIEWSLQHEGTVEDFAREHGKILLSIARKQLESEGRFGITKAEFQEELERLYKYADEVQFTRGYDKGWEESRKALVDEEIDVKAMREKYREKLKSFLKINARTDATIGYEQGIEDVIKAIKGE